MDITNFMTWWIQQVTRIFTYTYNLLDSITFGGTSLLRIIIIITILSALVTVTLTVPTPIARATQNERKTRERTKHGNKRK